MDVDHCEGVAGQAWEVNNGLFSELFELILQRQMCMLGCNMENTL